jgi:sulfiredoxin
MIKRETIPIADVYVPIKRRATLEQKRVDEIASSILDKGLQAPILVRVDGARFVLVEGLHRLEAAKALGEQWPGRYSLVYWNASRSLSMRGSTKWASASCGGEGARSRRQSSAGARGRRDRQGPSASTTPQRRGFTALNRQGRRFARAQYRDA